MYPEYDEKEIEKHMLIIASQIKKIQNSRVIKDIEQCLSLDENFKDLVDFYIRPKNIRRKIHDNLLFYGPDYYRGKQTKKIVW